MTRRASAAALVFVAACATPADDPETTFVRLEQQWIAALETGDAATLDALLADDFVDSTFRGTLRTKSDVLAGQRMSGPYRSVRLDELRVRVDGTVAIVTGVNVLQGTTQDQTARVRFTDVFLKRDGRWRAVAAQETLQSAQ